MAYDPARHRRRSIRLPDYDYASPGWYFVTICEHRRRPLFGTITDDGTISLSPAGAMVTDWWHRLPAKFPHLALDAFVAMPNHIHGLLCLHGPPPADPAVVRADPRVRPATDPRVRPTPPDPGIPMGAAMGGTHTGAANGGAHTGAPLPRIIQWWKTMTTNAYIRGVRDHGWPRFGGRLWQRNYWERVVRNDHELANVRRYIAENPQHWHRDRLR
jgi:REP element-mobilizing transposase RayT